MDPVIGASPAIVWDLLLTPVTCSHSIYVNICNYIWYPCLSNRGRDKENNLKYIRGLCSSEQGLSSGEIVNPSLNCGVVSGPNWPGTRKISNFYLFVICLFVCLLIYLSLSSLIIFMLSSPFSFYEVIKVVTFRVS